MKTHVAYCFSPRSSLLQWSLFAPKVEPLRIRKRQARVGSQLLHKVGFLVKARPNPTSFGTPDRSAYSAESRVTFPRLTSLPPRCSLMSCAGLSSPMMYDEKIRHAKVTIGDNTIMFANSSEQWPLRTAGMFI
jgi:hypothetical protein